MPWVRKICRQPRWSVPLMVAVIAVLLIAGEHDRSDPRKA
jgi:hypothetical protein